MPGCGSAALVASPGKMALVARSLSTLVSKKEKKQNKTGEGRAAEENISLLVSQKVDYKGNKDSGFICMGAYLVNLKYLLLSLPEESLLVGKK